MEGSARGHRGRPSLRSGEDFPTHVFSSTRVAADLPRTTLFDAICSGEHGEVICWPRRDSCRRRRVSSSDDSCDFAPLVSRPDASVGVLERNLDISSDDECLVRPDVGRDVAVRTAQFDEQVPPTLMEGASPNCLGSGRHGERSELPTPTRRRRLVVEVAPNVRCVCSCSAGFSTLRHQRVSLDGEGVLASHPWDSDEEDELDTHSRDRADDEPLVPATLPASIVVLREAGVKICEFSRNVVPRIHHQAASGGQSTESEQHQQREAPHSGIQTMNLLPTQLGRSYEDVRSV